MTYKYAVWSGGATSGGGLSVGTAWDVAYALADPSRLSGGDELRICDGAQHTMTFAARLMIRCGSGAKNNPVRIVGADASGNPYAGRRMALAVLAGDNRATWGSSAAVSPSLVTVDSVGGAGPGNPIQFWEIEDLAFDGVDGKPYTGIANQGAANTVYNNFGGVLRNCAFENVFHNVFSVSACADQSGTLTVSKELRVQFLGGRLSTSVGGAPIGVVISRPGPTAKSGVVVRDTLIDGKNTGGVGINLDAAVSASEVSGCVVQGGGGGIKYPVAHNGTVVTSTVMRSSAWGLWLRDARDAASACLISDMTVAGVQSDVNPLTAATHLLTDMTFINCLANLYNIQGDEAVDLLSTYRALRGGVRARLRNRAA